MAPTDFQPLPDDDYFDGEHDVSDAGSYGFDDLEAADEYGYDEDYDDIGEDL